MVWLVVGHAPLANNGAHKLGRQQERGLSLILGRAILQSSAGGTSEAELPARSRRGGDNGSRGAKGQREGGRDKKGAADGS